MMIRIKIGAHNLPGGVICNDRRLTDRQLDVLGHLVVDGDDDLALIRRLVGTLDVLDLQCVC